MTDNKKYNGQHKKIRAAFMKVLKPGTPCPQVVGGKVCNQPMWPGRQPLDLGHKPDGSILGIVHRSCNRRAGAINSNRIRVGKPPLNGTEPARTVPVSQPATARGYCDLPSGCRIRGGHTGTARCW